MRLGAKEARGADSWTPGAGSSRSSNRPSSSSPSTSRRQRCSASLSRRPSCCGPIGWSN